MKTLELFEIFLTHRSRREKILLFIVLILGIYFGFFHQYFLHSFENIQTLKNQIQQNQIHLNNSYSSNLSLQALKNRNQKLNELKNTLNLQSLSWNEAFMQINHYIHARKIILWNIDSENEEGNYSFLLSGNTSLQNALLLANFIEWLPLVHLEVFDFSHGSFTIKAKNHKITALSTQPHPSLTASKVIQSLRSSLKKSPLLFSALNPPQSQPLSSPNPSFNLQAILNKKAKINDRWVFIGEQIDGYTLLSIQTDSILLQSKNHQITLTLKQKRNLL